MQNENLNMYQLGYEPTRLDDFNDYFLQYLKTNDSKYFNEFLHFYEPILNRKATEFIEHNHIEEYRLPDLKQIFVSLLWDELQRYTADEKLPLLQIMKYNGSRESFEIEDISEIEVIIFDNYKSEQIKRAIFTLSPIERKLLELTTGINFDTFETKEKLSYNRTAFLLGMTESAVQKKRKRIIEKVLLKK